VLLCSRLAAARDGNGMLLWQWIRSDSQGVWPEYKAEGEKKMTNITIKPARHNHNMCI